MHCPNCGRDIPIVEGQRFCQFCGALINNGTQSNEGAPQQSFSGPDPGPETAADDSIVLSNGYCPWEDQSNLGLFVSMYRTAKESLITPEVFFSMMPIRGGYVTPLLYAMILGTIGAMASAIWAFFAKNPLMLEAARSGNLTIVGGVLIPISVLLEIVMLALLLHIALVILRGAHEGAEATFRVVCYTSVASLFSIIPIIGGLVGLVCKLYLLAIGLKTVHRISTGKAALAIVFPLLLIAAVALLALMAIVIAPATGTE